jgi:hypothetical protein
MVMTTRSDPQIKIRLPLNLKRQLKRRAKDNNRSTNAEIVFRLERSFETSKQKALSDCSTQGFGIDTPHKE